MLAARLTRRVLASVLGQEEEPTLPKKSNFTVNGKASMDEENDNIRQLLAAARAHGTPAGRLMELKQQMTGLQEHKEKNRWTATYRVTAFPGPKTGTITRKRGDSKERVALMEQMGALEDKLAKTESGTGNAQGAPRSQKAYLADDRPKALLRRRLIGSPPNTTSSSAFSGHQSAAARFLRLDESREHRPRNQSEGRSPPRLRHERARSLNCKFSNRSKKQIVEGKTDITVTIPLSPEAMSLVYAGMANVMSIIGHFGHGDKKQRKEIADQLEREISIRRDLVQAMKASLSRAPRDPQFEETADDEVVLVYGKDGKYYLIKEVKKEEKPGEIRTYFIIVAIEQSTLDEPKKQIKHSQDALNLNKLGSFGDPIIVTAIPTTIKDGNGRDQHILDVFEYNPIKKETYNRVQIEGDGVEGLATGQTSPPDRTPQQRNVAGDVLRKFVIGEYTGTFTGNMVSNTSGDETATHPYASQPFSMPSANSTFQVVGKKVGASAAGNFSQDGGSAVFKGFIQANSHVNLGVGYRAFQEGGTDADALFAEGTITTDLVNAAMNIGRKNQYVNIRTKMPNTNTAVVMTMQNAQDEFILMPSVQTTLALGEIDAGYRHVDGITGIDNEYFYSARINLIRQIAIQIDQIVKSGGNQEAWFSFIQHFTGSRGQMILRAGYTSESGPRAAAGYSRTMGHTGLLRDTVINALLDAPVTNLQQLSWTLAAQRFTGSDITRTGYGASLGMDNTGAFRVGFSGEHPLAPQAMMKRFGISPELYKRVMEKAQPPARQCLRARRRRDRRAGADDEGRRSRSFDTLVRAARENVDSGVKEVRTQLGDIRAGLAGTAEGAKINAAADGLDKVAGDLDRTLAQVAGDVQEGALKADAAAKAVRGFDAAIQEKLKALGDELDTLDQVEKGPRRGMEWARENKEAIQKALARVQALRERVDEEFARYMKALQAVEAKPQATQAKPGSRGTSGPLKDESVCRRPEGARGKRNGARPLSEPGRPERQGAGHV